MAHWWNVRGSHPQGQRHGKIPSTLRKTLLPLPPSPNRTAVCQYIHGPWVLHRSPSTMSAVSQPVPHVAGFRDGPSHPDFGSTYGPQEPIALYTSRSPTLRTLGTAPRTWQRKPPPVRSGAAEAGLNMTQQSCVSVKRPARGWKGHMKRCLHSPPRSRQLNWPERPRAC